MNDDAQRANQSIFMCFFHWGVHGWIPYILMAVNVGIVSHKWGLPLTIRACFYPLIGNTVYSFVGDLIDSISMGEPAHEGSWAGGSWGDSGVLGGSWAGSGSSAAGSDVGAP